jgi:DNA polymerase-2
MDVETHEFNGWLLDLYAGDRGIILWLLGDDGARRRLRQDLSATFYVGGSASRLHTLWCCLKNQPVSVRLARTEHRDLFAGMITVLAVEVTHPIDLPGLFRTISHSFPDLTYYDADLPLPLRHAAIYNTFPLARCRVTADANGTIGEFATLNSPWELDPSFPLLRTMILEPDVDPSHAEPKRIKVRTPRGQFTLDMEPSRALLVSLRALLSRHDPDLLLTAWGDTWLLPRLLALSQQTGINLHLNRDPDHKITHRPQRTYFAYGQVIHRGQQMHLYGRWHIDVYNAVMYHDYGLEGIWELARVTSLPVQTVARVSPGTGISAMQIVMALRQKILVPWHKQQAERPKTALELLHADQGGLVFQPTIGLHANVGEIDFVSMYPSIMRCFNISPETVGTERPTAELVPELGMIVDHDPPGLIPQTLAPLLDKRLALKQQLMTLSKWDARRKRYKACASAHKWLLVTCFGYLGYKNARFGRIEAHEAVTAYGREALLRAKEAAEDLGFTVLHLYVDGVWVKKDGCTKVQDFRPLLDEILSRTGLPIALDGIYRWVAFLPSRQDVRVPVANRYFGIFQDGTIKTRGIDLRRHDTPPFIAETQQQMLEVLVEASNTDQLPEHVPKIHALLRRRLTDLRQGRISLEKLLVRQTLSRELNAYRTPSPVAQAVAQLQAAGKTIRPGQSVRFLYTRGEPGVVAWDLPNPPDPRTIDVPQYKKLLQRAAQTVLELLTPPSTSLLTVGCNDVPGLLLD